MLQQDTIDTVNLHESMFFVTLCSIFAIIRIAVKSPVSEIMGKHDCSDERIFGQ